MIMNRKELAHLKLQNLRNGYSAFTDSEEIAKIISNHITQLNIPIHIDKTTIGYWFIPEGATNHSQNTCKN